MSMGMKQKCHTKCKHTLSSGSLLMDFKGLNTRRIRRIFTIDLTADDAFLSWLWRRKRKKNKSDTVRLLETSVKENRKIVWNLSHLTLALSHLRGGGGWLGVVKIARIWNLFNSLRKYLSWPWISKTIFFNSKSPHYILRISWWPSLFSCVEVFLEVLGWIFATVVSSGCSPIGSPIKIWRTVVVVIIINTVFTQEPVTHIEDMNRNYTVW